ncbi:hypothetical protein [Methylobacterium sp. A54F]
MANQSSDPDRIVAPPIDMGAVAAAAEVYLADPSTREYPIGAAFTLDLAATVAADPKAEASLSEPDLADSEKLLTLRTLFLMALLNQRTLYQ